METGLCTDDKTVADPGPLMPGVLDRWTPTVNV